jgi:hypothetical protein
MRIPGVSIIEQPSASPVAAPQTWAAPTGVQSSFGATASFYFNPNYSSGDVVDSYIDIPDTQTILTTALYVIPPGWGFCSLTSGTTTAAVYQVQQTAGGTWVTLFTGTISAQTGFFFMSDGVNFRINNLSATSSTAVFYRFR